MAENNKPETDVSWGTSVLLCVGQVAKLGAKNWVKIIS